MLCVGLAGGRAALSLERVAINLDDARIPDNAGQHPIDRPIVPGGPAAYFATLPIKAAVAALREAGLPASVSNTAGTFVCNHVFYGLMHLAATPGCACAADFCTCRICQRRRRAAAMGALDGAGRHRARDRDRARGRRRAHRGHRSAEGAIS